MTSAISSQRSPDDDRILENKRNAGFNRQEYVKAALFETTIRVRMIAECRDRPDSAHAVGLLQGLCRRLISQQRVQSIAHGIYLEHSDIEIQVGTGPSRRWGSCVSISEQSFSIPVATAHVQDGDCRTAYPNLSWWIDLDSMDLWLVSRDFVPNSAIHVGRHGLSVFEWPPASCMRIWLAGFDLAERAIQDWQRGSKEAV